MLREQVKVLEARLRDANGVIEEMRDARFYIKLLEHRLSMLLPSASSDIWIDNAVREVTPPTIPLGLTSHREIAGL